MLEIKNLKAQVQDNVIIKDLNLRVKAGETHVIMGPNGAGKSASTKIIAGDPQYEVLKGEVTYEIDFKKKDLLSLTPSERARAGVFLAFQYPTEIPGLNNLEFLKTAFNSICKAQGAKEMGEEEFKNFALEKAKKLGVDASFLDRDLNAGFSGGEKKQNEILQMVILSPRLAILDETDSGLDVDSLQKISSGINQFKNKDRALLLITHYHRLLELVQPDRVHIMIDGEIKKSGDFSLAKKIEEKGYDWIS